MRVKFRRIISLVAAIAILATMGLGAFSYFTDYATSSKTANAGTLKIELSDITEDLTNGLTIMNPGDSNPLSFKVTNVAEKSVDVKAVLTITTKDKNGNSLDMSESDHEYKITDLEGTELQGVLANNIITYTVDDVTLNGSIEKEDGVNANNHTYNYMFSMDSKARNAWQGSVATLKIDIFAKQHRNTESVGENWTDMVEGVTSTPSNPSTPSEPSDNPGQLAAFSITYVTNGGILPDGAADEYIVGVPVTLLVPTREGYEFDGWYEDHYFQGEPVTSTDGRDGYRKVYYAKWTEIIVDEESGINYRAFTVTSENRSKVGYTGSADENLVIPATFQDTDGTWYKVTAIDGAAFYGCSNLNSVSIPTSVTEIKPWTFVECSSLSSINFPNTLIKIGDHAFAACENLTSVTIPDSVTIIDVYAFWNCTSLSTVNIPAHVTYIGDSAFGNCQSLTDVTIPSGITTIEDGVFWQCFALTSITIPSGVTSIGEGAFYNCRSLKDVYYGGNEAQWQELLPNIGNHNTALTSATIHYNS